MRLLGLFTIMGALSLSGCQQEQAAQPPAKARASAAGTIAASGGRLVLPAVKGNPGAAYLTLDNRTGASVKIDSVAVDRGGMAMIHQTAGGSMTSLDSLELAPGQRAEFKPGGMHIMVFDVDAGLKAGGRAELTVTFAGGQVLKAPLTAEPPGGAMAGMDHGDMR